MHNSRNYSKFAGFLDSRMKVFETKRKLKSFLDKERAKGMRIGLVPTMGALHAGHFSLVQNAVLENNLVIVSIFVNPTQFNDPKDLKAYPRNLEADSEMLSQISPSVNVFAPSTEEMYPEGLKIKDYPLDGLDKVMEGLYRNDHFSGVCTVVEALFRAVEPHVAYFGEKDFQQLRIIRKMADFKGLQLEIKGCPIVREQNGLAMSSRNERLPKRLRNEASLIYEVLKTARSDFGTKSAPEIVEWAENQFLSHPEFKLEYFEIADELTLTPVRRKNENKKYRAFVAAYIGGVRLIDNIPLY